MPIGILLEKGMIRFKEAEPAARKKQRPAEKIITGLKEAIAASEKVAAKPKRDRKEKATPAPAANETPRAKKMISIRLDQDVIDHFKAGGVGWQSKINAELRKAAGLS
jgi:uncharacterized protein (DUF4415 family)